MSDQHDANDEAQFIESMRWECTAFGACVGAIAGAYSTSSLQGTFLTAANVVVWAFAWAVASGSLAAFLAENLDRRLNRDAAAAFTRLAAITVFPALIYAAYLASSWVSGGPPAASSLTSEGYVWERSESKPRHGHLSPSAPPREASDPVDRRDSPNEPIEDPVDDERIAWVQPREPAASYLGASVVVFLLYWLFFIPGLIFNCLFLNAALKEGRRAGHLPSGTGCLGVMLLVGLFPAFVFASCIGLVGTGAAALASGPDSTRSPERRAIASRPQRDTPAPEPNQPNSASDPMPELKRRFIGASFRVADDIDGTDGWTGIRVRANEDWILIVEADVITAAAPRVLIEARTAAGLVLGRGWVPWDSVRPSTNADLDAILAAR